MQAFILISCFYICHTSAATCLGFETEKIVSLNRVIRQAPRDLVDQIHVCVIDCNGE